MRLAVMALAGFCALGTSAALAQGAFLGAQMAPITPQAMEDLGLTTGNGAVIRSVFPGSPAAQAGLKPNQVIMIADGKSVLSPKDVVRIVAGHSPGEALMIVDNSHGHNTRSVNVTLGARPADLDRDGAAQNAAPPSPKTSPNIIAIQGTPPHGVTGAMPTMTRMNEPARKSAEPIALRGVQNQFCRAQAPQGWSIIDQDDRGATLTLASQDGAMKAAYGVVAVNSGQAQGLYGAQFTSPQALAQYLAGTIAGRQMTGMNAQDFHGAQVVAMQGMGVRGHIVYRSYRNSADPGGYILSARIALAPSKPDEGVAGAVAATIDCKAIFKAPAGGTWHAEAKERDLGTSSRCKSGTCDDGDLAGTYNVQLGTGYVHSASGENFIVDPTSDYRATGPSGPGYYRAVGNNLEKLEPGRSN